MPFLIDTNVLSERVKLSPNRGVVDWLNEQEELVVSSATLYEIEFGIKEMEQKKGKKAKNSRLLYEWFLTLLPYLVDIPINRSIALHAANFSSQKRGLGLEIDINDMIIAATAAETGRILVTRNIKDFDRLSGFTLYNPFTL